MDQLNQNNSVATRWSWSYKCTLFRSRNGRNWSSQLDAARSTKPAVLVHSMHISISLGTLKKPTRFTLGPSGPLHNSRVMDYNDHLTQCQPYQPYLYLVV